MNDENADSSHEVASEAGGDIQELAKTIQNVREKTELLGKIQSAIASGSKANAVLTKEKALDVLDVLSVILRQQENILFALNSELFKGISPENVELKNRRDLLIMSSVNTMETVTKLHYKLLSQINH